MIMATNMSLKEQLKSNAPQETGNKVGQLGLKALINNPTVQEKFRQVLKEKAAGFTSSVLTLVNNDNYLAQCEPQSILTCAMTAATLDLPLDKNLGYAYIVPFKNYKNGNRQEGQFILGYKGLIQLAMRSGQYRALNVAPVYEGELNGWNRLTETFDFDFSKKISDIVVGYVGYFELLNGFKKTVYWTKEEIENHRIKFAKGKNKAPSQVWIDNYDAMACKTVLRNLLTKWGLLSIEMLTVERVDEKVLKDFDENGEIQVVDPIIVNEEDDIQSIEYQEVTESNADNFEEQYEIVSEDDVEQLELFEKRITKVKE